MTKIESSALMLSGTVVLACSLLFAQVQRPGEYPRGVKPSPMMNFFVTSEPIGDGGNLGGLAGADRNCQALAQAAGAGNHTWHAYLSTQARPGQPAVNARDRIGTGPWYNAQGALIAENIAHLHGDTLELARQGNMISKRSSLTETGGRPKSSEDTPNEHDIFTGSQLDGTAFTDNEDHTCNNWTSADPKAHARIGHFDRMSNSSTSWVSAHETSGCDVEGVKQRGGGGLNYCFAIN